MKISRIKNLFPAPESAVLHYITSNMTVIEADEYGSPLVPTQTVTFTQWKRVGQNPAEQSRELKMRAWKVKNGTKTALFHTFQGVSGEFSASAVSGCQSVLIELLDGAEIVWTHSISINWRAGNVAHVVLDTYQSTVIVDIEGAVVKSISDNHARFYVGNTPTEPAAWSVTVTPSSHQGWGIMGSGDAAVRTLTFRDDNIIANIGVYDVVVAASYHEQTYTAQWEIRIEREEVRYELIPTPGLLVYNETSQTWEVNQIDFEIYTSSQVNARKQLTALPAGCSLIVMADGDDANLEHAGSSSPYWRMNRLTNDPTILHVVSLIQGYGSQLEKTLAEISIQTLVRNEAVLRPRVWVTGSPVTYTSGKEGERFKDVVIFESNGNLLYYECRRTATEVNFPTGRTPGDYIYSAPSTGYFGSPTTNLQFVATWLLLAQLAYIKNLGVNYLQIYGSEGKIEMYDDAAIPNLLFQVYKGNVLANTGTFNNIKIAGQSTFGGLLKKSKTFITSNNISEYGVYDEYSGGYALDLEKTGTWICIGDTGGVMIILPGVYGHTHDSTHELFAENREKVRSIVGNTLIIYNVEQQGLIQITGNTTTSTTGNATSFSIQPGQCAVLECKMRFITINERLQEDIYWLRSVGYVTH